MSSAPQTRVPMHLLRPEVLAGLSNLDLVARTVVEGFLTGLHRSPFFGFSQEFAEYRAYSEGDDPRFVDWNVYARTEKTYIKRYIGETNTHLVVLLDVSGSMDFGSGGVTKLQYAKFLAATLVYLAAKQHDAVGLIVFDEEVREHRPPSTRAGQLHGILHAIDRAVPGSGTNLKAPFERFREYQRGRGLVAVISDFYCEPEALLKGVQPLAYQGQDVALFQLLDSQELDPQLKESALFEDIETGETMEVSPLFMRSRYKERIREHVDALGKAALGAGAQHKLINIADPLDAALREYLLFRQRRG
ncbi:MAG TPA: DUF58 domain-containing protein [Gammaproteobacteria bacterium]|nr:DUF58 domain-containing protein [Gammaproteobacteria bacterium]